MTRRRPRVRILMTGLGVGFALSSCDLSGPDARQAATDRQALVEDVRALRDSLAAVLALDPVVQAARADTGHVMIGVRTAFLTEAVREAAMVYLDTVELHIEPDLVIEEGETVRVSVGPLRITAGDWRLRVTIERIEAHLLARSLDLAVADSSRLDLKVGLETRDGAGRARIDFRWDARAVISAVCRDFEVNERFEGVVAPRLYEVEGAFVFRAEGGTIFANPEWTGDRLVVRPEPTARSWERVREILRRQNHIFRCGIALQPDKMETMLRDLLERGFAFRLPESILGPIPLPAGVSEQISLSGTSYDVLVEPSRLWITAEALWYSALVDVSSRSEAPAASDPAQSNAGLAGA